MNQVIIIATDPEKGGGVEVVKSPTYDVHAFADKMRKRVDRVEQEHGIDKAFPYGRPVITVVNIIAPVNAAAAVVNWLYDPNVHDEPAEEFDQIVLQVMVGNLPQGEAAALALRFGDWYSPGRQMIEYPTSNDSHGFDVFRDEFQGVGHDFYRPVTYAALIVVPVPVGDKFVPFTEDSSGTVIAEWVPNGGWQVDL